MAILDILGAIFRPVADVINHITASGDEKIKLQEACLNAQVTAATQMMAYESQLLDSQSKIILAEATGQSWIQRNWRPVTMLVFLGLTVSDAFGWLPFRLADQAWELLKIGLGGYVVGRSVEKVAPQITAAIAAVKKP